MTHRCIFLLSWIVISPLTPPNLFTNRLWRKKISSSKGTINTNYYRSIGSLNLPSCCCAVRTVAPILILKTNIWTTWTKGKFPLIFSSFRQYDLPKTVLFSRWQDMNALVRVYVYSPLLSQLLLDWMRVIWFLLPLSEQPSLHPYHRRWIFFLSNK